MRIPSSLHFPVFAVCSLTVLLGLGYWMQWAIDRANDEHVVECLRGGGKPYRRGDMVFCLSPGARVRWVR